MKIAISAVEPKIESAVDQRFGRARFFAVYNSETEEYVFLDNEIQLNAAQGAGIQTAEMLAKAGAGAVLTGHCGPNAFKVLTAAGIAVYTSESVTIAEALKRFLNGELKSSGSADVEGHWV